MSSQHLFSQLVVVSLVNATLSPSHSIWIYLVEVPFKPPSGLHRYAMVDSKSWYGDDFVLKRQTDHLLNIGGSDATDGDEGEQEDG